jgi:hypothetical protein
MHLLAPSDPPFAGTRSDANSIVMRVVVLPGRRLRGRWFWLLHTTAAVGGAASPVQPAA